jgi:23S rRNA pseudouridine2604 synthase
MAFVKTYDGAEPVRVNKWLGQSGVCSRREADALIAGGQVSIDGVTITDAGHKISAGETLSLNDAAQTQLQAQLSLIYHKPIGIVSGQPEPGEIPAVRMIKRSNLWRMKGQPQPETYPDQTSKLAPIGRLDKDSRGLLILSEDGVLAKAIIGPESELDKEYIVRVRGGITEEKLRWLRHGLELDGRKLKPAKITRTAEQTLNFILNEGRNRQIRRMCDLVEIRVIDLLRIRIGNLLLGDLPEGQWRPLMPGERQKLIGD